MTTKINQNQIKDQSNVLRYGMRAAVPSSGTVSTSGSSVTGVGTNFTSVFQAGDRITFLAAPVTGDGYITTGPLPIDHTGNLPAGSLVTGFGGADFSALLPGDLINSPLYGGIFGSGALASGKSQPVNNIMTSTKLRTVVRFDPQVGSGSSYPIVEVSNNVAYITTNTPHGLLVGDPVTISGSGVTGLNGAYTVAVVPGLSYTTFSNSTCFGVVTVGVADGVYATEGMTLSAGMPLPAVSIVVSSDVATATFIWPHGLTATDPIRVAGYTGGGANLNGAHTVVSVGSGDYPTVITFATSGVSNGTYAQVTGLIGSVWTYTLHAEQATIASITDNTHMVLTGALSRNFPAGSLCESSPDNVAAYIAACSAAKTGAFDLYVPSGKYYFENTLSNTGATYGVIQVNDFHNSVMFSPGASFVLNIVENDQADNTANGFVMNRCDRAQFVNWRVDGLYQPPWTLITGYFPFQLAVLFAREAKIINWSSFSTRGGLYVQYSENITIQGALMMDSSGNGLSWDNVAGGVISDVTIKNTADESFCLSQNNATNREMFSTVVSNIWIRNGYDGVSISRSSANVISNVYVESSATWGLVVLSDTSVISRELQISNLVIRNSVTIGPFNCRVGINAAVQILTNGDISLSNFQIIDSLMGGGLFYTSYSGNIGTVILSCGVIDRMPLYGATLTNAAAIYADHVKVTDTNDTGFLFTLNDLVKVSDLVANRTAKTLDGDGYGANRAINFWSNTDIFAHNLLILDDAVTATGYKFVVNLTSGKGRVSGVRSVIADVAHPLTYVFTDYSKVFIEGLKGDDVASANTIVPTGQVFHVTGTALLKTITPPSGMEAGDWITTIADGAFTWDATGNLIVPSGSGTAVVGQALRWVWDGTKFYPDR